MIVMAEVISHGRLLMLQGAVVWTPWQKQAVADYFIASLLIEDLAGIEGKCGPESQTKTT